MHSAAFLLAQRQRCARPYCTCRNKTIIDGILHCCLMLHNLFWNRLYCSLLAGGPINLNFLGHYDYWARWKALVTENSKMSSSGSFSLMPQRYQMSKASNLPFYFQKRQNRRIFVPFLYFLVTLVVALEKMTLRMTFLNSL